MLNEDERREVIKKFKVNLKFVEGGGEILHYNHQYILSTITIIESM